MNDIVERDVVIVGAGVTGLTTGHYLTRSGLQVTILDGSQRHGGVVQSERKDGFLFEHGPNSLLKMTSQLHELFCDIGIRDQVEFASPAARNRYIVRRGRLMALPLGPFSALRTPLFRWRAKLRVLREPFISPLGDGQEESLADFVRRRLGAEMLDYAINPFVAGVYAGSPDELSVEAGFPKIYQLERRYGSLIKGAIRGAKERRQNRTADMPRGMFSFKPGMTTLVDGLVRALGPSVRTGTTLRAVHRCGEGFEVELAKRDGRERLRCRALILAIPSHAYESVRFEFDFPVRDRLSSIAYPPVTVVFFGFRRRPTNAKLDGFGFLVPEKENRGILGTIWNSAIFSGRAPSGGGAFSTFVGGTRQPRNALLDDEGVTDLVARELRELMAIEARPDVVRIKRWPKAIPQYVLGHLDIIRELEVLEKAVPGLYIEGNFRGGISVMDRIERSAAISKKVLERFNVDLRVSA